MTKSTQDDLFEGTSMSFGDHLEELRVCLFRGVVGIVIGCCIGFWVANNVVRFFQSPLEQAMEKYYLDKATESLTNEFGGAEKIPVEFLNTVKDGKMIPDKLRVDPADMWRAFNQAFPGATENPFENWTFIADDITDPLALAKAIAAGEKDPASPAGGVFALLDEAQRKNLPRIAALTAAPDRADLTQLLSALNAVANQGAKLYDSPAWQKEPGADATTVKALREQLAEKFDESAARRLNKLLLIGGFSGELRQPQVNLTATRMWVPVRVRFQVLNAQEAFMIWMKAALTFGLVLAAPWVFYQVWNFVAAGLYPHEKNQVYVYLPISILLFIAGASLAFTFVFQPVLDFLFTFNKGMNADFDPRIGEWLSFVLILPIGFGLSFQLPLVMLFLNRIGVVAIELYYEQWRVAVLAIFVISMVLTPADPISMLLMACPLCLLYVLGIGMCKWMPRGRSPFTEVYEP